MSLYLICFALSLVRHQIFRKQTKITFSKITEKVKREGGRERERELCSKDLLDRDVCVCVLSL